MASRMTGSSPPVAGMVVVMVVVAWSAVVPQPVRRAKARTGTKQTSMRFMVPPIAMYSSSSYLLLVVPCWPVSTALMGRIEERLSDYPRFGLFTGDTSKRNL
jgi:hypothetical protein